jgi:type IV secretion system protein TrbI
VAKELEAINSKMMVADFDDRSPSSVKPLDPNALEPFDLKSLKGVGLREASLVSAGVAHPGATPSKGVSEEEFWRQAIKPDEDKQSQGSLRSQDGAFLKEFSAEAPLKPALRSSALESRFSILEGSVIAAILGRDVNSDLPGVITATVSQTVYDSVYSQKALICKGAKLIGRYSNEIRGGQSRLLFAFSRLILNDGRSFNLLGFEGSDEMGGAGAKAQVDNHFLKLYGSSLAIGVLSDRVSRQNLSTQGLYTQPSATGQVLVQTTKEILQRNQDSAPTLTVAHGTRINVEVRRDLIFPSQGLPQCT